MANENENSNSEIETINLDEITDIDVLKEHYQTLDGTYREVADKNKHLFERTKKAEGFELKEGKWVKPPKETPKGETKVEHEPSKDPSKPSELDYGQKAFLKAYGISGSEELALIKQFQDRGFGLDSIVEDDVFKAKLTNLREAKESQDAIPKGKGRSAQVASTNIDLAYAKFKESGEWPQDFDTAKKLKDKIVEMEAGTASIYARK